MLASITETIEQIGPFFAVVWAITILCVILRPQKYFNSMLLMFALMITLIFIAAFFGDSGGYVLLYAFVLIMLVLFLVPVLLIINGIVMLRKEGYAPAHVLSLALGIVVGIGEIATIVYVLGLAGSEALAGVSRLVLFVSFTVFYFSFLVLSFVVYSVFIQIMPHRMDFDYLIIHGCGLADGERLTPLLKGRVDKAAEIYQKCRNKPVIIPSGGKGGDEKISEAQAMKDYLLSRGIPEESIIIEDRSVSTEENVLNSKAIIDARAGRRKTALISSSYHVYRCLRIAKDAGLRCTGIGSGVALYFWPSALIREFIAVFVTRRFLIWSLLGYVLFISPFLYELAN